MEAIALPLLHVRPAFRHRRFLSIFPVLAFGLFALVGPRSEPAFASVQADGTLGLTQALAFTFSWPVSRTLEVHIQPAVTGQLSFQDPLVGNRLVRKVVFTPDVTWEPGTTYEVTLVGVRNATGVVQRPEDFRFSFRTPGLPALVGITPGTDEALTAGSSWVATFNQPLDATSQVSFVTDPVLPLTVTSSADATQLTVQPQQLLPQGHRVTLHVQLVQRQLSTLTQAVAAERAPEELAAPSWQVREPPGITSIAPSGTGVATTTPLTIQFAEAVAADQVNAHVHVAPDLAGSWTTQDRQTYQLSHAALDVATTYTLTVTQGLTTERGGVFNADVQAQFRTVEPIQLVSSSPADGQTGTATTAHLQFTFNQGVTTAAVRDHVRMSPAVSGTWAAAGSVATFTPKSELPHGTTYTVTFTKGLLGQDNLPLAADVAAHFTTEQASTRLAVAFHRQEHKLSCEAAALYMALRYRGVAVSEQDIITRIGFDPTPKKNGVWGDPDVAFVGDINGSQPGTGYGVYDAPIANVAAVYRAGSRVLTGATLADVLTEVRAGNPVVAWGNASTGQRVDWKTSSGKSIVAIVGEHARVVIGFVGSVTSPTTIITMDPLYGERRFSTSSFLANWGTLGNRAVVVE